MKRPNFLLASDERGKSEQFKLAVLCYRYDILGDFPQEPAALSPACRKPASCRPWEPCPTREGCIQPLSGLPAAFSEALLFQGRPGNTVAPYELLWGVFLLIPCNFRGLFTVKVKLRWLSQCLKGRSCTWRGEQTSGRRYRRLPPAAPQRPGVRGHQVRALPVLNCLG